MQVLRNVAYQSGVFLFFLLVAIAFFHHHVVRMDRTFLAWFDNSVQYYAWMHKSAEAWRRLTPPLWDFYVYSGTSFVGELQTGAFYPLNIIFAWLVGTPTPTSLDRFLVLHFALAAYGMWAFLRRHGMSALASAVGSVMFAFTGTVASRGAGQANIFAGLVFFPFVVLFCRIAWDNRLPLRWNPAAYISGGFLGVTLLAGHPQPFIHAAVLLVAYVLYLCASDGRPSKAAVIKQAVLLVSFVGLIALAVAAIQVLPSIEYFSRAYRWVGLDVPVSGLRRVPYESYKKFALDWGDLAGVWDAARRGRDGASLFLTISGAFLAALGLISGNHLIWFAFPLAMGALLVALGDNSIIGRLSYHVPVINMVREPERILCLYQFGMSVMAGAGLDWVLNRRTRSWLKMTVATVVVSSVVIEAYKALILVGAPSTTSQSAIAYYRPRRFTDYLQAKMRSEGGLYRVVLRPKDVLPPNLGDVFPPISTLLGHRSSMLKAYFDFLNTDWSLDSPTYDLLGVKYVVSNQPLERLPLVFSDDGLYLYDRPHALPVFQLKFQDGRHEAAQTVSVKWEENSVHLALVTREPTRLVFAQPDFPGWVAEINNKRVPLVRDLIFMSVFVPAGRSEIVFRYAPWWYPVGLALWASILVAFVVSMRGQASSSLAGSR